MARSMSRRGNFDETDVKIRPGKRSRPRTKERPAHDDAVFGMVVSKDRGRWGVQLDEGGLAPIVCMRARELGRTNIVVGDRVGVVGDTSGKPGSLARIVKLAERTTVLRRTADDTDPYERIVVGNAKTLLIVVAAAEPTPRTGFVGRALVAAYVGGLTPVLVVTKSDLADPSSFLAEFAGLDLPVVKAGINDELTALHAVIDGQLSAVIGHSGVGKSTLVNRLVPDANRETGAVSGVGKGRHTSTQSVALALPEGGWIIDTPGIRSFGLAHVAADDVLHCFQDLSAAAADCPRGCGHLGAPSDPECALDSLTGAAARRVAAVRELLIALRSNEEF